MRKQSKEYFKHMKSNKHCLGISLIQRKEAYFRDWTASPQLKKQQQQQNQTKKPTTQMIYKQRRTLYSTNSNKTTQKEAQTDKAEHWCTS